MQISISYLLPLYEILLRITLTTLELTKLTTMNRAIESMNQILLVIRLDMNATQLMITLRTTRILKYSTTTTLRRSCIIKVPGKPLQKLRGMWKNTVIWARTHGFHLLVGKVFNLLLGSSRVKFRSPSSTITFQVVTVTRRQLARALGIRRRSVFDSWICMAHIYDGSRDRLRTTSEHSHSSIVRS